MRRVLVLGLIAAVPLAAQQPRPRSLGLGFRLAIGRQPLATPACDNSGFQATVQRKRLGTVLLWGGGAVAAGSLYAMESNGSTSAIPLVTIGLGSAIVGGYIKNSADDPDAMDKAVQSLKVGETKCADVLSCLGRPQMTTTRNGGDEIMTYSVRKIHSTGGVAMYFVPIVGPLFAGTGGVDMRSVTLTFKNGVLSDISKTAGAF
jgi:hypothetical protein